MESLACPRCGCKQSRVLETRELTIRGHFLKMRVRQCRYCSKHFKTKEIVDQDLTFPSENRSKSRNNGSHKPPSLSEDPHNLPKDLHGPPEVPPSPFPE